MKWLIDFCAWLRWFIIGGEKTVIELSKHQKQKRELAIACEKSWSKKEYLMHHRNAASNLGMLGEARKWWYEQPYEYRKKKEDEWKKRYGRNWRKHVVI